MSALAFNYQSRPQSNRYGPSSKRFESPKLKLYRGEGVSMIGKPFIQYIHANSQSTTLHRATMSEVEDRNRHPPERRLISAVLGRSIQDLLGVKVGYRTKSGLKQDHETALEWFRFEGLHAEPESPFHYENQKRKAFSFVWICEHLDIDPHKTAAHIYKMYEARLAEINEKPDETNLKHLPSIDISVLR